MNISMTCPPGTTYPDCEPACRPFAPTWIQEEHRIIGNCVTNRAIVIGGMGLIGAAVALYIVSKGGIV